MKLNNAFNRISELINLHYRNGVETIYIWTFYDVYPNHSKIKHYISVLKFFGILTSVDNSKYRINREVNSWLMDGEGEIKKTFLMNEYPEAYNLIKLLSIKKIKFKIELMTYVEFLTPLGVKLRTYFNDKENINQITNFLEEYEK